MLQLSLDLYYTEDEIYELSYTKEPKNPKIQVSRATYSSFEAELCVTASDSQLSHEGGHLSALCGRDIFKTKAQTQCRNTSKSATSKPHTLGKRVMWWVCSFFLVSHMCSPSCLITASVGPQPVAPVKPPVVAEWGSGVTPRLDPDTISKHVKQMVDVSM